MAPPRKVSADFWVGISFRHIVGCLIVQALVAPLLGVLPISVAEVAGFDRLHDVRGDLAGDFGSELFTLYVDSFSSGSGYASDSISDFPIATQVIRFKAGISGGLGVHVERGAMLFMVWSLDGEAEFVGGIHGAVFLGISKRQNKVTAGNPCQRHRLIVERSFFALAGLPEFDRSPEMLPWIDAMFAVSAHL